MKDNKFLQGVVGVLALVLIVLIAALTRNAFAQYNYIGKAVRDRDTIVIAGEGKVTSKPDLARVDMGVTSDGSNVGDTQRENTKKMNEIIAAVKKLGVDEDDIQTTNYSIYPRYDYTNGRQVLNGYTVSQNITVKIRNLDSIGNILGKVGELGANQVGGIQFTIDDPKSLQQEARLEAIDDARKKAEELAKQLGLTILKVVSFSESSGGYAPMPYLMDSKAMGMGGGEAVANQVESGSLDVMSNVNVVFEVR